MTARENPLRFDKEIKIVTDKLPLWTPWIGLQHPCNRYRYLRKGVVYIVRNKRECIQSNVQVSVLLCESVFHKYLLEMYSSTAVLQETRDN